MPLPRSPTRLSSAATGPSAASPKWTVTWPYSSIATSPWYPCSNHPGGRGELLRHVGVFDLYEGERIPSGKKSVAFSLRFGADRTLTDEEVDARLEAIVRELERRFGAQLRR